MKGFNLSTGGGAAGSVTTPLGGVPSLHSLSTQLSNPGSAMAAAASAAAASGGQAKKSSLTIASADVTNIDMKKSPMQR